MDDIRGITLNYVKQTANNFLEEYHPQLTLPIPIEDIVELKLGIRIILIGRLVRDFSVNAFINQDFDTIIIDEVMFSKQPERIRFTIAEEIGHLFLHKNWYQKNGPKGITDYLEWQESLDSNLFSYIERQAKTFAGMVLIPESSIIDKFKQLQLPDPCSVYDLPDTFPELARDFAVSPDCLLTRLSTLKLVRIPDGFWNKVSGRKN